MFLKKLSAYLFFISIFIPSIAFSRDIDTTPPLITSYTIFPSYGADPILIPERVTSISFKVKDNESGIDFTDSSNTCGLRSQSTATRSWADRACSFTHSDIYSGICVCEERTPIIPLLVDQAEEIILSISNRDGLRTSQSYRVQVDHTGPDVIIPSSFPATQCHATFDIPYENHGADRGILNVILYWRTDPTGSWNLGGSYTTSPIHFTVPENGTYYFAVVATNRLGISEPFPSTHEAQSRVEVSPTCGTPPPPPGGGGTPPPGGGGTPPPTGPTTVTGTGTTPPAASPSDGGCSMSTMATSTGNSALLALAFAVNAIFFSLRNRKKYLVPTVSVSRSHGLRGNAGPERSAFLD